MRSRVRRALAARIAAAGLVCAALTGWWVLDHVIRVRDELGQAALAAAVAPEPLAAIATAEPHVLSARAQLNAVRPLAQPIAGLSRLLAGVPGVGPEARAVAALWTFADATTNLGSELVSVADLGLAAGSDGSITTALLHVAPSAQMHLEAASVSFAQAATARAELDKLSWPFEPFRGSLARWDVAAPQLDAALRTAASVTAAAPHVLGEDRPATYLVLAQSSDDLRATGGFITSVGTVRLEGGRVTNLAFEKVYDAEGLHEVPGPQAGTAGTWVQPPAPLSRYMGLGHWLLRDANWWADFPTTARQAARFWEMARGEHVDGVVAFNEEALQALLVALGPVTLANGDVISDQNVKSATLARVFAGKHETDWYASQTAFSEELAHALLSSAEHLPRERWRDLAAQLRGIIRRHDLLVASFDPTIGSALSDIGADGVTAAGQDDYLYVVEQNVSYGKLSPFIRQDLAYTVTLDPDGRPVNAILTIDATNTYRPGAGWPGYPAGYYFGARWNPESRHLDTQEGFYGGYTRLYLPHGSRLLAASGFDDGVHSQPEGDHAVVGGYVGLSMGTTRQVRAEWVPAAQPRHPGQYRLLLPRQPGAPDHALTVRVALPTGYHAEGLTPPPDSVQDSTITWRTMLNMDRAFEVTLTANS